MNKPIECRKAAVTLTSLLLDQRANKGPVGGQLEVVNDEMNKPMEEKHCRENRCYPEQKREQKILFSTKFKVPL